MTRLARTLLAVATLSVVVVDAEAQNRVDRSGATDANQRVGSYGRNTVGTRDTPWEIQNRIVYGNVTGGKAFRGNTASGDPQAFRGNTGSTNYDRFVRNSSSVTTGGVASYNANQTRAFYGDSRAVAPPANFVSIPNTGGSVAPSSTAWTPVDVRQSAVSSGDRALVNRDTTNTLVSGGEVNLQYAPMAGQATPYSIGQLSAGGSLSDYTQLNTNTFNDLTPSQIKQGLSDDPQSQLPGQTQPNQTSNTPNAQSQIAPTAGNPTNNVGGNTRPGNPGQNSGPADSARITTPPVNNSVNSPDAPEVGTVTRMVSRPGDVKANQPDQAGAADAARAAENRGAQRPGQAAEDAAREFNAQMKAAKDKAAATDQPKPTDGAKPPVGGGAGADAGPKAPPAKINSIAVANENNTPGLSDLLIKAEGQMKAGQFANAADTYNAASRLAPRAALVDLGRANAEIGGQFYVRAEQSLRRAYSVDKDLLKSQVDLRNFLGDDRLATATKDLSDLVQSKATDTSAAVLLAYVYYNTGNETRAQALLDLADKRTNGRDPLVTAMKTGWTFPAAETK